MNVSFVPHLFGQADPGFCARLVVQLQLFFDPYRVFFEKRPDDRHQVSCLCRLFELRDIQAFVREQVEHFLLFFGQRSGRLEFRIPLHTRFALQLQAGRNGCIVDIPCCAEVITGHPFPELILVFQQNRMVVEHFGHFLDFVIGRWRGVCLDYNPGVISFGSEGNDDTASPLHFFRQTLRDRISELTRYGQRHYDIDIFLHRAKIQRNSVSCFLFRQINGVACNFFFSGIRTCRQVISATCCA